MDFGFAFSWFGQVMLAFLVAYALLRERKPGTRPKETPPPA